MPCQWDPLPKNNYSIDDVGKIRPELYDRLGRIFPGTRWAIF